MRSTCPKRTNANNLSLKRAIVCKHQQHTFPRPHTLHKQANNGLLTLNNRPVAPKKLVTDLGNPYKEAIFESTIPIFADAPSTVSFRDNVLRRIDRRSCKWVVSRTGNTSEAVFSAHTRLLDAFDTDVQHTTPLPFRFQGVDVVEKLILHKVAILIVDTASFNPSVKKVLLEGRLWVPPSNVKIDMDYVTTLYNSLFYSTGNILDEF